MKLFNNLKSIVAFTLAEVLIVLGIIGIIAEMTIPTVISNVQDRSTITLVKKAYSTLSQAYTMAQIENGNPTNWGFQNDSSIDSPIGMKMFSKYLKITKDCTDISAKGCFKAGQIYKTLFAQNASILDNAGSNVILADGMNIHYDSEDGTCTAGYSASLSGDLQKVCGWFYVDVNGFKSPNQYGRDTFGFYLTQSGIIPFGTADSDISFSFETNCIANNGAGSGLGCTGWLIHNDNLDYLKPCRTTLGWSAAASCN